MSPHPSGRGAFSVVVYRLLLQIAFPPSFRHEYGDEMEQSFSDRVHGAADGRPAASLGRIWSRTLLDLARHGAAEWMQALRRARPAPLHGLRADVRQTLRSLASDPGFTLVALATLALGVGANTAVFSVVDAVLLRPLPFPAPDDLVAVARWDGPAAARRTFSYPDFVDVAAEQSTFERLAPYAAFAAAVQSGDVGRRVVAAAAPPELFDVLEVAPGAGRVYDEATADVGGAVALVSARLASAFGSEFGPGSVVDFDGVSFAVAGIMPSGFDFPGGVDVWVPLQGDEHRGAFWLAVVGRLSPGVTAERAEQDVGRLVAELGERYPGRYVDNDARVEPLQRRMTLAARPILLVLLGTVAAVLLIACANLAGLSIVRASGRTDDLRVRVALGAGRARIARLAMVESAILAATGAAIGLPLAAWSARMLARLAPDGLLGAATPGLDMRVLAFTLALTAAAAILAGLLPALRISRSAAAPSRGAGGRASPDGRTATARRVLVAGEVALAVSLLGGAALLGRTLVNLQNVPLGFDPEPVRALAVTVRDAGGGEADERDVADFVREARGRLLAVPGVTRAAAAAYPPFGDSGWGTRVRAEGASVVARPDRYLAHYNAVTPGYFETLDIPLVRGRTFDEHDGSDERVAVVSETLARTLWPGQDALGRRVTNEDVGPDEAWMTVVGIVGDVHNEGLTADPVGEVYQPYDQLPIFEVTFLVTGLWERPGLAADVRDAVGGARAGVTVPQVEVLADRVDDGRERARFGTLMIGVFAALAISLASLGVYGLIAYSVNLRRREFGLRIALGARPSEVGRVAAGTGLAPAALGVVIGVGLVPFAGRALRGLLFGVEPTDPVVLVTVVIVVGTVALIASAVPAVRASASDPMTTLRGE